MTATDSSRRWTAVLVVIAAGAWVLRVSPFLRVDGILGWPLDYDEGVYVSASALLWRGVFPYRDFFFVHPPGVPLLFGVFTVWPVAPSQMLGAVRVAMTLVGTANVLFIGLLVRRHAGIVGAVLASVLYASYPMAVYAERGAYLEPLLNFAALAFVAACTADSPRLRLASLAGSAMLLIKSWGVLWLVGACAGARSRSESLRVLGTASAGAAVVILPFFFLGPFVDQTVLFHLRRPPDGTADAWYRLSSMVLDCNWLIALITLVGLIGLAIHRARPIARISATVFLLLVAGSLMSAAWWSQYNAHLAVAQALVVGIGWGLLWQKLAFPRLLGVVLAVAVAIPGVGSVIDRRHNRDQSQLVRVDTIREASKGRRSCAFEALNLLMGDALPSGPVDLYAQMLNDAVVGGTRYASATEAFSSEASQARLRSQLDDCDLVVVGWRGGWQMNARTKVELDQKFSLVRESVFVRKLSD